jgi:hypothetical protein
LERFHNNDNESWISSAKQLLRRNERFIGPLPVEICRYIEVIKPYIESQAAQYIYDIPSNNCANAKKRIRKRLTSSSRPTSKKVHPEIRGDQWNRSYKGSPCAYLTKPNTTFSLSSRSIKRHTHTK